MQTYFIVTPLPLALEHRFVLAGYHRESTGNELAVIPNAAKTACIVKVKTARLPEEIVPSGMVASDVLSDLDEARALLASEPWTAAQ